MTKLASFWHQRDPREKTIIAGGAFILLFSLGYAYFWSPAMAERDKLINTMPTLRLRAQAMEQMSQQAQRLGPVSGAPKYDAMSAAQNIFNDMRPKSENDGIHITSESTNFDRFIKRLAEWEKSTGGKVKDCDISKTAAGLANISCLLTS